MEPEHPRVCGENLAVTSPPGFRDGTSPRMRGKRPRILNKHFRNRNIPAYAGKTPVKVIGAGRGSEHPRVCGENSDSSPATNQPCGTSPRMRGKQTILRLVLRTVRNIPAYAGKTTPDSKLGGYVSEHPRVCGENQSRCLKLLGPCGTSPRMRGKLVRR